MPMRSAYHRDSSPAWRKPGRWIACASPTRPMASSTSAASGPSPQRTRSQAIAGRGGPIAGEGADQARQVLLGGESVDGEEVRGRGQAVAAVGRRSGGLGVAGVVRIVHRVVAQGDPISGHPQGDEIVAVPLAADQGGRAASDPAPLDRLLPPDAGMVDLLALRHQDRRPARPPRPAERGGRLGPASSRRSPRRRDGRDRGPAGSPRTRRRAAATPARDRGRASPTRTARRSRAVCQG